MKALMAADLHITSRKVLGRSRLGPTTQVLADVIEMAVARKVDRVFLLGDVIDQKVGMPLDVYLAIWQILVKKPSTLEVVWIRGNHESPDRADPDRSLVNLFGGLVRIVSGERAVIADDTCTIHMVPWFPADRYLQEVEGLHRWRKPSPTKREILMSHVGLAEGRTGPSNFYPPSRVSVADLRPGTFDAIFLGDYHTPQRLKGTCAFYLGSPVPHAFGDPPRAQVFEFDTSRPGERPFGFVPFRVEAIPLVNARLQPMFDEFEIPEERDPGGIPYEKGNYTRIRAAPRHLDGCRRAYPEADLRLLGEAPEAELRPEDSRLSMADNPHHGVLVERYVRQASHDGLPSDRLIAMGTRLFEEEMGSHD